MQGGYISYGLLAALAIALLIAAFTDLRRRQIDNWLTAAIALGAPLFWWSSGLALVDIGWQLAIALLAFAVCAALFAMRAMGGGDVKLLTALALWMQPVWFAQLVVVMSLLGGALTIGFGAWHFLKRREGRVAVPYGIAISAAGIWTIASQHGAALQAETLAGALAGTLG